MTDLQLILIAYSPLALIAVGVILTKITKKKNGSSKQQPGRDYLHTDLVKPKERLLSEEPVVGEYASLCERLTTLMDKEKLYLKPEIRLGEVAERLMTNKTSLSKAIKETTNRNFCQLVHYYRIKELMRIFAKDPNQNIQDLAFQVGFNSLSTFNIAFGRIAGYTPAEWSRDYKNRQSQDEAASRQYDRKK